MTQCHPQLYMEMITHYKTQNPQHWSNFMGLRVERTVLCSNSNIAWDQTPIVFHISIFYHVDK